jgi:ribosomal-protein-alanine N-acetyltransferase
MLPTIFTERLILRNISLADAKDMFEYAQTSYVGPVAGWHPHKTLAETKAIINMFLGYQAKGALGVYAIVLKNENKMIGTIELFNYVRDFKAEMGYALNPSYWGNGFVPEAAEAILAWGFDDLNLKRIEINLFTDNHQSERVCQKLGMTYEGLIRNGYLRYDGLIFDEKKYSITDKEYYKTRY